MFFIVSVSENTNNFTLIYFLFRFTELTVKGISVFVVTVNLGDFEVYIDAKL